jgi:ferrochelatase
VLCYVTSGFSCYSGCRQYRENIASAIADPELAGMEIHKIRVFYNHPDFIDVLSEAVAAATADATSGDEQPFVAFTAHSIPMGMANTSDYVKQLTESCRLAAERLQIDASRWRLVYQSRSGRPEDPWLEPDILDFIRELHGQGCRSLVISPVGFLSDHMEVLYDLDDAAKHLCDELGMQLSRARTPGNHPRFISMVRKLIQERFQGAERECIGLFGPNHDVCPVDCCPAPQRPASGPPGRR